MAAKIYRERSPWGKSNPATQRFIDWATSQISADLEQQTPDQIKSINENLLDEMLYGGGGKPLQRDLTKTQELTGNMLKAFFQLQGSYVRLHDFEVYFRRFPYAGLGIEKHDHLQCCIEGYLQEIYVLYERHKTFVKATAKLLAEQSGTKGSDFDAGRHIRMAKRALGDLIRIRGHHVHNSRYEDEQMSQLQLIHIVQIGGEKPELGWLYLSVYKDARKKWLRLAQEGNHLVRDVIEVTCREVVEMFIEHPNKKQKRVRKAVK